MQIHHAVAFARADAARIAHWSMLTEDHARQAAMLDDLLEGDMADAVLYIDWLVERLATDAAPLPGVLRFTPHPRLWHADWITLAA